MKIKSQKIKYAVGIILLIPFVYYAGINSVKTIITPKPVYIFLAFCFTCLAYFVDSLRWGMIINEVAKKKVCSYKEYFVIYASSMSLSQFISQTGGMFILRPVILKEKYNLDFRFSYISIIIEKSADFFFLFVFLSNSVIYFFVRDFRVTLLTLSVSLVIGYFLYSNFGFIFEKIAYVLLKKIKEFRNRKNKNTMNEVVLDDLNKFQSYSKIAFISIIRVFIFSLRLFFLILGIKLAIPYLIILLGIPIAQLSLIFSITPGAMGILEGGWLGALTMVNIPKDIIGTFLVGQRFYLLVFDLLVLLLYFTLFKKIISMTKYLK